MYKVRNTGIEIMENNKVSVLTQLPFQLRDNFMSELGHSLR
jgi:hypothetical protein